MFDTPQQVDAFARALATALATTSKATYGTKAPVGVASATGWPHGVGGLFGVPGLDQDVISARIVPQGISSILRVFPSQFTQPMFPYVTGVEEEGDDEPLTECATCPSGVTESCIQSACFGFVCRETRELTPNRAIERLNRGELDLTLVNDILGLDQTDPWQVIRSYDRNTLFQIATVHAMLEVGVLLQNKLLPMVWQGNPANNVGTGYAEFNGLDILISTGKVDFLTSTACPALDSDVKEFGYQNINTVTAAGNFRIVRMLSALENYLYHNATRMRLWPTTWAFVMRPEMWMELTEIWPAVYLTTRNIVLPAGNTNMLDATRLNQMRDDMRSGMFLMVNGRRHQVITDDGIFESTSANDANVPQGSFASSIYQVPLTYLNGNAATYLQHKDYRATAPELQAARLTSEIWPEPTDAGRFLWTVERVKWCYTLSAKVEPRIVLKTPQLAGRIDHILIDPEQHTRDPFQDSDYFLKGGVESRTFPFGRVYPDNAPVVGIVPTDGHCDEP